MAFSSHGTFLQIGDGATPTEVFTTIPGVMDISGPPQSAETIEVTSHDSGGTREYVAGLKDGGDITFTLNYTGDPTHKQLRTDQANQTVRNFQLILPLGGTPETLSFAAFVTGLGYESPVSGATQQSVTLKVTGPVVSDIP